MNKQGSMRFDRRIAKIKTDPRQKFSGDLTPDKLTPASKMTD